MEPFTEVQRAYDFLIGLRSELRKKINERAEKFETRNDILAIVRNRVQDPSGYLRFGTSEYPLPGFLSVFDCYAGGVAAKY